MIKPFSDQVYGKSIRPLSGKPQLKIIDFQKKWWMADKVYKSAVAAELIKITSISS